MLGHKPVKYARDVKWLKVFSEVLTLLFCSYCSMQRVQYLFNMVVASWSMIFFSRGRVQQNRILIYLKCGNKAGSSLPFLQINIQVQCSPCRLRHNCCVFFGFVRFFLFISLRNKLIYNCPYMWQDASVVLTDTLWRKGFLHVSVWHRCFPSVTCYLQLFVFLLRRFCLFKL